MIATVLLLQLWLIITTIQAAPNQGGTISYQIVNPFTNGSTVEIIIYQKHSWILNRLQCNRTVIASLGWYTDGGGTFTGQPFIQCQPLASSCSGTGFTTISERTYCTDFSTIAQISSGALIKRMVLFRNAYITVGYTGTSWPSQIQMTSGAPASNWALITRINLRLRPDGYINSAPSVASLPVIRVIEGQLAVIQFSIADWNTADYIRCRWASSAGAAGNECGDVCNNLPNANISYCTIKWLAVRRPIDIAANLTTSSYIAAIMVEDFFNFASVNPMSSVPLQVLISTYQPAAGACSSVPEIIGDRPDRTCVGAPVNVTLVERIVATVFCAGDYIVEFITTSPMYMTQTAIANVSGTTNQRFITLAWTPTDDQIGPQMFCAAPVTQRGLTGSQYCLTFAVGFWAPDFIRPTVVQGSASPLGTVFSNHSLFSIQSTRTVYRTYRSGTYIQIFDRANSTLVWQVDCGYSSDCIYSGQTLLFYVSNAMWTYGAHYYILFGSGVVSSDEFCGPESTPVTDPTFWTFDIWNPGLSSTTASTTTPPTTGTVTTRHVATTTPNVALTTTGIVITTVTTVTTSSVTTTQTDIMAPTEPESQWKQSMIIGIVIGSLIMLLITILCVYVYCTRQKKTYDPQVVPMITSQDEALPTDTLHDQTLPTDIPHDQTLPTDTAQDQINIQIPSISEE